MQYWVGYHMQHEFGRFSGEKFYMKAKVSAGDHLFVVCGDRSRAKEVSYFLAGEYEIAQVNEGPFEVMGRTFHREVLLKKIVHLESPVLLSEAIGIDLIELRNRHASGTGQKSPSSSLQRTFERILDRSHNADSRLADIVMLINDASLPITTREQWIDARLGQGKFRQNVIQTWGIGEKCAVTGVAVRDVLTASHIVPWSESEELRLEGSNGIILCAHLDRLFDRYLLSFDENGAAVFSTRLNPEEWKQLSDIGITRASRLYTDMVSFVAKPRLQAALRNHLTRMRTLDLR